jgi:hypothetical protein
MRLVIGGPTLGMVPASFAIDLAQLYTKTYNAGLWWSVTMGFVQATYVHVGREAVLLGAIARQATHVLFLDTDMTFPAETALRLLAHDKPLVAANCVMRDPRRIFTAQRDGQRIPTDPASRGLERVDRVGMAVALLRTDLVAAMDRPWFAHGWAADEDIGEDVRFCDALRDAGHQIFIDHDLSQEVGHIGQYTYRPSGAAAPLPV